MVAGIKIPTLQSTLNTKKDFFRVRTLCCITAFYDMIGLYVCNYESVTEFRTNQGCQIFHGAIYQNWEKYTKNTTKYSK
jgi:hypothetical protein